MNSSKHSELNSLSFQAAPKYNGAGVKTEELIAAGIVIAAKVIVGLGAVAALAGFIYAIWSIASMF